MISPRRLKTTLIAVFLCSLVVSCASSSYDVVVTRYEALTLAEVASETHTPYLFSFCLCNKESRSPFSDYQCHCSFNVRGKKGAESAPKALYPTSCLHHSTTDRCLVANFPSDTNSKFLYVRVRYGSRLLTSPEWQSLPVKFTKATASLASVTNNRFIRLDYRVLKTGDVRENHVTTTARPPTPFTRSVISESTTMTTTTNPKSHTTSRFVSHASGALDSLSTNRIEKLADALPILLKLSLEQKIPPFSFDVATFRHTLVELHNRFRLKHNAKPLSYDTRLEAAAQSWANILANAKSCLIHEHKQGLGENLFLFSARYFTDPNSMADAMMRTFYGEGKNYNYQRFIRNYFVVGHFTQLIWKSTTRMGVGVAIRQHDGHKRGPCQPSRPYAMLYVVVKYTPTGNVQNQDAYFENVVPPQ